MKKILYFLLFATIANVSVIGISSCKQNPSEQGKLTTELKPTDDKTVYGLACDGCTDSVVYLLPSDGSDPIKYDVIDAYRNHRIMGKLKIGDWIGVVLNEEDSTVADMVIDLDQLKGTWCYVVMPQLRDYEKLSKKQQARITRDMDDSIKADYLIPREYGFTLKRRYQAQPVGFVRQASALEDESPVVYPTLPYYMGWHILNGKLLLSRTADNKMPMLVNAEAEKNGKKETEMPPLELVNDTAQIIFMNEDSLVLQFNDHLQSYYRLSDASEANKLAREKAAKLTEDAKNQLQEKK